MQTPRCLLDLPVVFAIAGILAACSSARVPDRSSTTSSPGGTGGGSVAPNQLSLTIHRAWQTSVIHPVSGPDVPAPPGSYFISVDFDLANGTYEPAPLASPLFTLETGAGLEFMGGPETAFQVNGCPQNASVTPGQSTRCVTVFTAPENAVGVGMRYTTADGREVTAVLSVDPCQTCGSDCVDVEFDDENCGACGVSVGLGHCRGGSAVCNAGATFCSGTCVDLTSDPANCGACGAVTTSTMQCVDGQRLCSQNNMYDPQIACGDACVSATDSQHCGSCSSVCPSGATCQGTCTGSNCTYACHLTLATRTSCTKACGSLGCSAADAIYVCTDSTQGMITETCATVPPAGVYEPGTTIPCTFVQQECDCK